MTDPGGVKTIKLPRVLRFLGSTWTKVLISLGVVGLLVYFNRVDASVLVKVARTWPWLLAAFLLMLPPFIIVSYRFMLILRSQEIRVPFRLALRWTMIGSFFDLAMPSSNGGDLVKAGYVVKYAGAGQRTRAAMAVVFDRGLGLLGLFLLAAGVSVIGWEVLRDMPARNFVVGLVFAASLGALAVLRAAGSRRLYHHPAVDHFLLQRSWGLRVKQFIASFNALRERPAYLFSALALSVLNHVFWCGSLLCLARVIGVAVEPLQGFVVFPLAIFSNIFGVAGGFGGGTVGFDLLLSQLLAISNGALLGLLFQTLNALSRLAGLPFYLQSSPSDGGGMALTVQVEADEAGAGTGSGA